MQDPGPEVWFFPAYSLLHLTYMRAESGPSPTAFTFTPLWPRGIHLPSPGSSGMLWMAVPAPAMPDSLAEEPGALGALRG